MWWYHDPCSGACPEFKESIRKFIAVGDLDQATSDHLDVCPTCTALVDALRQQP